jgi:predicted nucleic-acid-binding Zn-ribbon protein
MKVQCKKCGKKEAEFMSKHEIKASNFANVDSAIVTKILDMADNLFSPNYIVCKSCGHLEKA